jgi:hypothetical protein
MGRSAVRCIRASVSLSLHWLSAATPPAASEAPSARKATFAGSWAGLAAKYPTSAVRTESRLSLGFVSST